MESAVRRQFLKHNKNKDSFTSGKFLLVYTGIGSRMNFSPGLISNLSEAGYGSKTFSIVGGMKLSPSVRDQNTK